jgi:hypothetical protein
MIKRILPFFVLFFLVAIFGCKEQPIPTYEDLTSDRYIYFGRSEKDSLEVSFMFYPGQKVIDLPAVMYHFPFSRLPFKRSTAKLKKRQIIARK